MKQHFLTSQFLWVRNLGAAQLGPLAQVSHKAAVKTLAGAAIGSKLYLEGRILFQEHSCGCWRIWFLLGCWTKGFYSLLSVGQCPPSIFCRVSLSTIQLTAWQLVSLRASKQPRLICNRISGETFQMFFCCIPHLRSKSVGPDHACRERITQGHKYQETWRPGSQVALLEAAYYSDTTHYLASLVLFWRIVHLYQRKRILMVLILSGSIQGLACIKQCDYKSTFNIQRFCPYNFESGAWV